MKQTNETSNMAKIAGLFFLCAGCLAVCANQDGTAAKPKVLNNFVSEIADWPLADGECRFSLDRDGWVHIAFDKPHFGAEAFVDGGEKPAVAFRGDELSETMRYLEAGTHTIRVAGAPKCGGRISIRSVKAYRLKTKMMTRFFTDVSDPGTGYGYEFHRRWLFPSFNMFVIGGEWKGGSPGSVSGIMYEWLSSRGKVVNATLPEKGLKIHRVQIGKVPQKDLKAAYDRYFLKLATAADCRGIDVVDLDFLSENEELVRWIARLVRHYGIEGNAGLFSERFDPEKYSL